MLIENTQLLLCTLVCYSQIEAKEEAILETKKEIKQLKKELKGTTDSKLEK